MFDECLEDRREGYECICGGSITRNCQDKFQCDKCFKIFEKQQ